MASLSSIFPFGIGYNEGGTGLSGSMALRPPRRLLELAAKSGKLRRVFVWGRFVTSKPAPKDLDILP